MYKLVKIYLTLIALKTTLKIFQNFIVFFFKLIFLQAILNIDGYLMQNGLRKQNQESTYCAGLNNWKGGTLIFLLLLMS